MRLIILEGPDGGGKSTLAAALADEFKARVIHHGPYLGERRIAHHYLRSVYRALYGNQTIIMDRSWVSEPIYGAAMRGGANRISVHERRILERLALRADAVVLNVRPTFATCEKVWRSRRGEEYVNRAETLKAVYAGYFNLDKNESALPIIRYNREAATVNGVVTMLRALPKSPPPDEVPGIGRYRKGVTLLVGEKMGGEPLRRDLPFIGRSGCSPWLSELLDEHGVLESSLYWVNAFYLGVSTNLSFIEDLKPKTVIALGQTARFRLLESQHPFLFLPHPQFWKRFCYHRPYPLLEFLQ